MDRESSWQVIEQQRLAIADLVEQLSPEELRTPSLCTGWSVRTVALHVAATPVAPPLIKLLPFAFRARGDYNRMVDMLTRHFAQDPDFEPVALLRAHAASRKLPKLTNYRNILFDSIVHGQDIAIPLGRTLPVAPEAAAAAADRAVQVGRPVWDKHRLDGLRLVATDTGWSHGSGAEIRGPMLALLLLITCRPAGFAQVSGPGVEILRARLQPAPAGSDAPPPRG
ncbi:maleylpyruvate isomerase family mycothiol-dependent enzyme [Nocardia inohanensis]|uniref:maleylpyruvate isomerase family mycothiol-dependent enzyme n=1 Tax=Nocardia inohanensis TaxID=209246 RepID=UPI0008300BFD|nr:maleylpyruvate isomerase family mycothiol-dependent enzyme [Nocardia inohanensis]